MRFVLRILTVAVLCWSRGALSAASVPIEVYGHLPVMRYPALSPDATRLAYVRAEHDRQVLIVVSLKDRKILAALAAKDFQLRGLGWADNEVVTIITETTAAVSGVAGRAREWNTLELLNVASGKVSRVSLSVTSETTMNVITGWPIARQSPRGTHLFVRGVFLEPSGRRYLPALFRIDASNGQAAIIAKARELNDDWLIDAQGEPVASVESRGRDEGWQLLIRREGRWVMAASGTAMPAAPVLAGLTEDGGNAVVLVAEGNATIARLVSLKAGGMGEELQGSRGFDLVFLISMVCT